MEKLTKKFFTALMLLVLVFAIATPAFAAVEDVPAEAAVSGEAAPEAAGDSVTGSKAIAAAITVGLAAAAGAIGMGWSIAKSVDSIARQPEAEGQIRTTLMLGLVFVETAIIYALVVAILIIFVL